MSVREALRHRHDAERAAKRTADPLEVWERHFVTQVAASWILSCVFVRTLEDRGLLGHSRIAGPGAADSQRLFFELAPSLTEREYLLTVFRELARFPATNELFDARHNPIWLLGPSAEMAKKLVALFRTPSADAPGIRFGQADTRFLGDLYQDLSADVRARFALLQTPHFIEKYILDRTLERAIERFGLDETTLIDPTCGSGHFLLGAFERLVDHRLRKEPGLDVREAARRALDAVYGADINPYAVAIARFRLTLAFLDKAGYARLADAPALPLHVVVADSLLHNPQHAQAKLGEVAGTSMRAWGGEEFSLEDASATREVLDRRFAAVVGNPPYITVKDSVLRDRYREMYSTAFKTYSMGVPFTERFFQLANPGGFVGMITANSFMKREFGKKLIEEYLPHLNVDGIVNTSGAYIPGHGTPTVLLFGVNEAPVGDDVLAVLAKRGEPSTPLDAECGEVWSSIATHGDEVGFENGFISVATVARSTLKKHPWSLGGGGSLELKELLEERASARLESLVDCIGFAVITGEDNVLMGPAEAFRRKGIGSNIRRNVVGEEIRDWSVADGEWCVWPNSATGERLSAGEIPSVLRYLWPYRQTLKGRKAFGTPVEEKGIPWWALREVYADRMRTPMTISFPFVATHNHFVLDRGGRAFNRTAPIIKLKEGATEEDHLALLAYLNSSTACFWMKQAMMNKGGSGIGRGVQDEAWEARFEFDGTKMATIPVPADWLCLAPIGREMTQLAELRTQASASALVAAIGAGVALADDHVQKARTRESEITRKMVGLQERLDFEVYRLFRLTTRAIDAQAEIAAGARPFEVQLVRDGTETAWFARQGYAVPDAEGIALDDLGLSAELRLIEQPNFKRRWILRDVEKSLEDAVYLRLQELLEQQIRSSSEVLGVREIERLAKTAEVLAVASLVMGADCDPRDFVTDFVAREAVPFLSAYRHTEAGLEKRAQWECAWDRQRAEDRGETIASFDPPPKYDQKDYRDPTCWRLRGKLDVPKERFVSYPGCASDEDRSPVYGWAGWNHLQQAQALAALYQKRKTDESWAKERLTPMLAGLLELVPWVKQWHNEPSADFGGLRLGDYFETFLDGECHALGLTRDDLRAWRPAERQRAVRVAPAKRDAPELKTDEPSPPKKPRKPRAKRTPEADPVEGE